MKLAGAFLATSVVFTCKLAEFGQARPVSNMNLLALTHTYNLMIGPVVIESGIERYLSAARLFELFIMELINHSGLAWIGFSCLHKKYQHDLSTNSRKANEEL